MAKPGLFERTVNAVFESAVGIKKAGIPDTKVTTGPSMFNPTKSTVTDGYMACSIAFRCIDTLARAQATTPWMAAYEPDDGERRNQPRHPLTKLMQRPNGAEGGTYFRYSNASWMYIFGQSFWWANRPSPGQPPISVEIAPANEITVKEGPESSLYPGAFEWRKNGRLYKTIKVDPVTGESDMLQLDFFNPVDRLNGLSPLQIALPDIDIVNVMKVWNKNMLMSEWRSGLVLKSDRPLTKPQKDELKKEAKEQLLGYANVGELLVLEPGLEKIQMGFSPKEIDWIEGHREFARMICHPFGLDPYQIGIPGQATFNNVEQAETKMWRGPVRFMLQYLEDELNNWLVPMFNEPDLTLAPVLDGTPALEDELDKKYKRQGEAKDIMSVNQRLRMIGQNTLEGGDVIYVPQNSIPVDAQETQAKGSDYIPQADRDAFLKSAEDGGMSRKAAEDIADQVFGGSPGEASEEDAMFIRGLYPDMDAAEAQAVAAEVMNLAAEIQGKSLDLAPCKGALPYKDHGYAPMGTAWNGPRETSKASAQQLKEMCAWVDGDHPELKGSYKLGHHRQEDLKGVWRGIAACSAIMAGSRGGVDIPTRDRKGVLRHLSQHHKDLNKPFPAKLMEEMG